MEAFKLFATMSLQDLISNPLQKIQAQLRGTENASSTLTGKFASLGKSMLPMVAAAGVFLGALGLCTAKAAEFEQSMAAVSTMFGNVSVDTANLNDKVLDLSSSTGIAATEIGGALYNALSSGIPVTEDMAGAMDFMTRSSRLAKAGFTDIDTAVSTTAKILNAYKMDVSETDRVHKILMQTQNSGITTVGELGQSLAQVTPTAAAMNVSFEQIGAALASMTAQGTPTAQATTQLNGLLAELGKTGTQASELLKNKTGSSFKELVANGKNLSEILSLMQVNLSGNAQAISKMMSTLNPATGKLTTFEESLQSLNLSANDISGELINMFGSIDAGKAALSLSGANAEAFAKNLEAMGTSADVVGDAYNKVTDTLSEALKRLSASKDALLISVGSLFTPILKLVSNVISKITQGVTALTKTSLGAFLLKAGAGIAAMIAGFTAFIGVLFLVKLAIAPISLPILALIAALALLYVAFDSNFGGIADIVGGVFKKVSIVVRGVFAVFQSLKNGVGEIKGALAEDIKANGLVGVITTISKVIYRLWQFISGFVGVLKGAFTEAFTAMQPMISAVSKAFSMLASIISFVLSKFFNIDDAAKSNADTWGMLGKIIGTVVVTPFKILAEVIGFAGTVLSAVVDSIAAVVTFFKDIFSGMSLFEAGKKLISTFADGIMSVINKPKEILMDGLSSLRNLLPFSDAKEGPLSTLTLSGERMMTTLAGGIGNAASELENAAISALGNITPPELLQTMQPVLQNATVPDLMQNIIPSVTPLDTRIPAVDMDVKPVVSSLDMPEYESTPKRNSVNNNGSKTESITININSINLPEVTDGETFINSLRGLALSVGVRV